MVAAQPIAPSDGIVPVDLWRMPLGRYHALLRAGVLRDGERIELLDGILVQKMTQSPAHSRVVRRLTRELVLGVGDAYEVQVQLPISVGKHSEPEPDLSVIKPVGLGRGHPRTALLVVEVAHSSHARDELKASIYARARIPEYWMIDLRSRTVEVRRDPSPRAGRYRRAQTLRGREKLRPLRLPGPTLTVEWFFE